jgi:hypothetical protein
MESREFVRLVKHEAVDDVVRIMLEKLKSPRPPRPVAEPADPIQKSVSDFFNAGAIHQQQQAAWFLQLDEEQQKVFTEILYDCAELSALSFCVLIDGVGGSHEGIFELRAVDAKGGRTLINPQNSDMLHDLLSDVCAEDRRR